jgi:hypothetical protein
MEYSLELEGGKGLLLQIDKSLSLPVRRLLSSILRDAIQTIKSTPKEVSSNCFYFNLHDLYPHLDLDTGYHDSIDMISSLFQATTKTTLIWFHGDEENNRIYDGWAPLIGEISWFDEKWWMQYCVPSRVFEGLKDKIIAPWITSCLEKTPFPKMI